MLNDDYMKKLRKNLIVANGENDVIKTILLCERILKLYKDNKVDNGKRFAEDFYNVATVLMGKGEYTKAIEVFEEALAGIGNSANVGSLRSNILNNLAICQARINDYDNASKNFEEALKIKNLLTGQENDSYIELLCNIGNLFYEMEEYERGIDYHLKALNLRRKKDLDFADNLNFLGYGYEALKDFENALNYFEQAINVIKSIKGANSNEYIANIVYIAGVYFSFEKYEDSLKYYEIVTEKIKLVSNEENLYYVEVLDKMAAVCIKLGNFHRAIMLRLKAMNLVKNCIGEHHIFYANAVKNAADTYRANGEIDRCVKLYEQEVQLKKEILGEDSDSYLKAIMNLDDIYLRLNDIENAEQTSREILRVAKRDSELYKSALLCITRVYMRMQNAELLYKIYDVFREIEPSLSFDDMLEKAMQDCGASDNDNKYNENESDNESNNTYNNEETESTKAKKDKKGQQSFFDGIKEREDIEQDLKQKEPKKPKRTKKVKELNEQSVKNEEKKKGRRGRKPKSLDDDIFSEQQGIEDLFKDKGDEQANL